MFGEPRAKPVTWSSGCSKSPSLRNALLGISREFLKTWSKPNSASPKTSRPSSAGFPENSAGATDGSSLAAPGEASDGSPPAPAQMGKQEALKRFVINLTDKARKGEIDPVSGRDEDIVNSSMSSWRRRQNNPILTGEAGVGKTAVVEGFALRLATGDVRRLHRCRTCSSTRSISDSCRPVRA